MEEKIIQKINLEINSRRGEILDFAISIVKELSENPPGNEIGVSNLISDQALRWNFPKPIVLAKKIDRPNLIFKIKGEEWGKTLIFNGHIDTKPIGDISKWTKDPYKPQIIGEKLYGRGSTDMKGGVVGILAAIMAILYGKFYFKGDILIILSADEEAGAGYGTKYLIEKGITGDAILIAEPSGIEKDFDSLGLACRGALLGKVITYGTQMHSSISDQGNCVNASVKMAEVLLEFAEHLKEHLNYKNHYLYPKGPTINPGVTLNGGIFYGVIPGEASFGFDIRVIPGMDLSILKTDIINFLNNLMKKDKELKAELVLEKAPLDNLLPVEIEKDHPLIKACIQAEKSVLGIEPKLYGVPFSTDATFFANELNIPTIPSFGPGLIKLAHGPDEYINIDAIINSAKIFAIAALEYLNNS